MKNCKELEKEFELIIFILDKLWWAILALGGGLGTLLLKKSSFSLMLFTTTLFWFLLISWVIGLFQIRKLIKKFNICKEDKNET